MNETVNDLKTSKRRGLWSWILISLLIAVCVMAAIGEIVMHRAMPILKGRVIETLSTRFDSRVEMDNFSVSVLKGLEVSGAGLRIYPPDEVFAAGAKEPLIALGRFSFHANLLGLFVEADARGNRACHGDGNTYPSERDAAASSERSAASGQDQNSGR